MSEQWARVEKAQFRVNHLSFSFPCKAQRPRLHPVSHPALSFVAIPGQAVVALARALPAGLAVDPHGEQVGERGAQATQDAVSSI